MKKITRQKFIKGVSVFAATFLVGCDESGSGSYPEHSFDDSNISSSDDSSSAGLDNPTSGSQSEEVASSKKDETEWKETVLQADKDINTIVCTVGELFVWAEASALALYREDIEEDDYIWHGEGALGMEFAVTNEGKSPIILSTNDFSAVLDGKNIKIRKGYMSIHGDSLQGFFDEENPRKIASGESAGEVIAFDVPTEKQYTGWNKMVITFHPESTPNEKIVYTIKRGKSIHKPIFSAVKMTKANDF